MQVCKGYQWPASSFSLVYQWPGPKKREEGPLSPGPSNLWGTDCTSGYDINPRAHDNVPARRATTGSAGLDLCAASGLVLTPEMGVQILDTDVSGPLQKDTVGLLLGRSSSTLKGLIVFPGVIDPDYTGRIRILCHSPYGVISIAPGDRVAQLLILPSHHSLFPAKDTFREDRGLGSSGVDLACLSLNLDERPLLQLTIEGKEFSGLVDTGADKSIIKKDAWPRAWPLQRSTQALQGLGYAEAPHISTRHLTWITKEGQTGTFQPFVLEVPINLWGRDIQTQMNLRLTNDYSEASKNMMRIQGFVPGTGLGKHLQGRSQPIIPKEKLERHGLGFS